MSETVTVPTKQTAAPAADTKAELRLRRGCDCGQHTLGGVQCDDCREKNSQPEHRASGTEAEAVNLDLSRIPTRTVPPSASPTRTAQLIVADSAMSPRPGQLTKTAFLAQLRDAVRVEAEAALAGTGRATADCPYLEHWFNYYQSRSSDHIESAVHRYAPETGAATTAAEYIPILAARVRRGVERWARTGEVTGVPGLESRPRTTTAPDGDSPAAVREELGRGTPLERGVRTRMETAFGQSLTHVRTHTDSTASKLSSDQNAMAVTVGEHIAFGSGEYRPGTIVGDALIAHELAHVIQQDRASATTSTRATPAADNAALEREADEAAHDVVAAVWDVPTASTARHGTTVSSRVRTGLRLQRCASDRHHPSAPSAATPSRPPVLQNPVWDVAATPVITPRNQCSVFLMQPGGGGGMTFSGNVQASSGCEGRVYFVQYVRPERKFVYCVGNREEGLCRTHRWGVDTKWPYEAGTNTPISSGETRRINTVDSPGERNISDPNKNLARLCIADKFVTYIVFEDLGARLTSLGWFHWQWNAQAWRDNGTCGIVHTANDCTGWQVTGAGAKQGENFTVGSMHPEAPLSSADRTPPYVSSLTFDTRDCSPTECPAPAGPTPTQTTPGR